MKKKIFSIINLGCFKNLVDSQVIMGLLFQEGFFYTDDLDVAGLIIINTCGFISSAKKESIAVIREAAEKKRNGTCKKLIVVGCLVQREQRHLMELEPEIDALLGVDDIPHIIERAGLKAGIGKRRGKQIHHISGNPEWIYDGDPPRALTGKLHYAFLKIAEGCNHSCSFCIIPFLKGNYRSRSISSIVKEARGLADASAKELILISQDTSFFGYDKGKPCQLILLLRKLVKIPKLRWIRLLYLYPEHVSDELIEVVAAEEKVCKYFDIPFQHGSERILRLMNRVGSMERQLEMIQRIRHRIPGVSIRTSLIVGFPGETEEDFEELKLFCREAVFDNLGVFIYYDEKEANSNSLPGKVPYKEKIRRRGIIMQQQRELVREKNNAMIGKKVKAIIDERKGARFQLRHQGMAPEIDGVIYANLRKVRRKEISENYNEGDIVDVKILKVRGYDLEGEIV